jgi:hypothetical protein
MPKRNKQHPFKIPEHTDPWWQMAFNHAIAHDSLTAIQRGTPEHAAWCAYFARLGWKPACLDLKACTMPAQWPSDLEGHA